MTPAPADRPCGCEQSQLLAVALAAANARVAELEAQLAKLPSESLWTDYLRRVTAAEAELAALRSRLDPGNVDAVERVAAVFYDARRGRDSWRDDVRGNRATRERSRVVVGIRAALAALSGGG